MHYCWVRKRSQLNSSLLAPSPAPGRETVTTSTAQLLSLACFKARLCIPRSSAGLSLDLHSCRHGWKMRCIIWKHLIPEVLANQPWGLSISSSPTRCTWMQVSSWTPDSSACGKHISSASFLGSRGEANTDRHTHLTAVAGWGVAWGGWSSSACFSGFTPTRPKQSPMLGACDGQVRYKESWDPH